MDGNLIVEFERKICVFQCLCGTDNTVGSHASKKRQIAWEDVGCPAWARITATARQDSKTSKYIYLGHLLTTQQHTRLLRSIASKAILSTHWNARILISQHGPPGFPSIPTSGSMRFSYFRNQFRWRSFSSSVGTKRSAYMATPSVTTPIDFGSSHTMHHQYTVHMPRASGLLNGAAPRKTWTSGSGKKLRPRLIPGSLKLVSTIIHPHLTPPLQPLKVISPSSSPPHPRGKLPGATDIRSKS